MAELKIGDVAPDFELPIAGGGEFRLSDQKGKPVVLFFYPQDDTPSCTTEAVSFSALADQFDRADCVLLGISPDPIARHERFRARHGLKQALASDPERKVIEVYGVWAEKKMYGRTYMGLVRSTFLIAADGRIARIWSNLRVKGHAEAVLAELESI